MPIVSLVGIKEGVGNTSINAALATILARQGRNVLAIDLCPDNALRLHLGMPWDAAPPIHDRPANDDDWRRHTWRSPDGAYFLPNRGSTDLSPDITGRHGHEWITRDLPLLGRSPDNWILLDTPLFGGQGTRQALAVADITIVITNSEPSSYIRVLEAWSTIETQCQSRARARAPLLVINQFDPRAPLQNDIQDLYRNRFGDTCFPRAIPHDTRVAESLGKGLNIANYAPDSPVASRVSALALWIGARKRLPEHS